MSRADNVFDHTLDFDLDALLVGNQTSPILTATATPIPVVPALEIKELNRDSPRSSLTDSPEPPPSPPVVVNEPVTVPRPLPEIKAELVPKAHVAAKISLPELAKKIQPKVVRVPASEPVRALVPEPVKFINYDIRPDGYFVRLVGGKHVMIKNPDDFHRQVRDGYYYAKIEGGNLQ